jgi:opacity protein-like surface antigen
MQTRLLKRATDKRCGTLICQPNLWEKKMKFAPLLLALLAGSVLANDVYHQGYMRNDGTYVQPHYQTAPNNTRLDNYSTQGNVNPYTGQAGTVNPYPTNRGNSGICPYGQRC